MLVACLIVLPAVSAHAQGNVTLMISLQVQPSINLVFQNNPNVGSSGYCALVNAGTNNVQLDFGTSWLFSHTHLLHHVFGS